MQFTEQLLQSIYEANAIHVEHTEVLAALKVLQRLARGL